jgi:hypothetical protein
MFYVKNRRARKYFVGRRVAKNKVGVNMYYSVPIKKSEKKASRLSIVDKRNPDQKVRIDLDGRAIVQLRRVLEKGRNLMK